MIENFSPRAVQIFLFCFPSALPHFYKQLITQRTFKKKKRQKKKKREIKTNTPGLQRLGFFIALQFRVPEQVDLETNTFFFFLTFLVAFLKISNRQTQCSTQCIARGSIDTYFSILILSIKNKHFFFSSKPTVSFFHFAFSFFFSATGRSRCSNAALRVAVACVSFDPYS